MAPANGSDERRNEGRRADGLHRADGQDPRRARARRNALLLGLVAAGIFAGYILLGLLKGIFPG